MNINNWKLSVWRSGISPAPCQQEGVSLKEGVVSDDGGVASMEVVSLKELKEAEGTGLNALWPIRRLHWTTTSQMPGVINEKTN